MHLWPKLPYSVHKNVMNSVLWRFGEKIMNEIRGLDKCLFFRQSLEMPEK